MRARAIDQTRQRLGSSPREFSPTWWREHTFHPPMWCTRRDRLRAVFDQQAFLFREGRVVWGVTVQANVELFEPGAADLPAMAIYSLDPAADDDVPTLREVARGLFSLKNTRPGDAEERRFAEVITDEYERAMKLAVPASRARGLAQVYSTTVLVHRPHLPQGTLTSNVFPLLVHPGREETVIVPSRYWSERILFEWGAPVGRTDLPRVV